MKFFAALLLATLCVAAYSSPLEAESRGIKDTVLNQAKKLKSAISSALEAAKGKISEFVKVLGEQKEPALAKINELKAQLTAQAKEALAQAADKAKKQAAQKLVEEINKAIGELNNAASKINSLQ